MAPWLKLKYPIEVELREKLNAILFIPIISGLIFFLLQPYGFLIYHKIKILLLYSLIMTGCLGLNYFTFPILFPRVFSEKSWTVGKSLLFFIFSFLIIGFWVHVTNALVYRDNPELLASFSELVKTVTKIITTGTIASSFYILIRYNIITRNNLQLSQDMNEELRSQIKARITKPQEKNFKLEIENQSVEMNIEDFVMAKSEGNYVALFFFQNDTLSSELYRKTISELETDLNQFPEIFRCHRSYIVNLQAIESSHGNSQGLSIRLNYIQQKIPVARPRIKELRQRLKSIGS